MSSDDLTAVENKEKDVEKIELGAETKTNQVEEDKPNDDERQLDVYGKRPESCDQRVKGSNLDAANLCVTGSVV